MLKSENHTRERLCQMRAHCKNVTKWMPSHTIQMEKIRNYDTSLLMWLFYNTNLHKNITKFSPDSRLQRASILSFVFLIKQL